MGKIISMYEYQKDKEAVKKTFMDNFFEVEGEKDEEEPEVEMPLYSEEDVDELLSSYLPYEEKLEILRKERDNAAKLAVYMDNAEDDFCYSKYYLDKMKENKKKKVREIKQSLITTVLGTGISVTSLAISAAYLSNHAFSSMSLGQTGAFFIFSVGFPILSLISGGYLANDISEYKQYDEEIKRYRKILK